MAELNRPALGAASVISDIYGMTKPLRDAYTDFANTPSAYGQQMIGASDDFSAAQKIRQGTPERIGGGRGDGAAELAQRQQDQQAATQWVKISGPQVLGGEADQKAISDQLGKDIVGGYEGVGEETTVNTSSTPKVEITDEQVAAATPEKVEAAVTKAGGNKAVAKAAGEIAGKANSKEDVETELEFKLRQLDGRLKASASNIEKAELRRQSMALMGFGLALLSGEGIKGATQVANTWGSFGDKKLEQLYDDRNALLEEVLGKDKDYAPANIEKQIAFADKQLASGKWDKDTYDNYVQSITDPAGAKYDEESAKHRAKTFGESKKSAGDNLASSVQLNESATRNMDLIDNNIQGLGSPADRLSSIRALRLNLGWDITGNKADDAVIEKLEAGLNEQVSKVVAKMRSEGTTFGAMTIGEWDIIKKQVGKLEGSSGGIYAIQGALKAAATLNEATEDAYLAWANDPANDGKDPSVFKRQWLRSEERSAVKAQADKIAADALERGREINKMISEGEDYTPTPDEPDEAKVEDILKDLGV